MLKLDDKKNYLLIQNSNDIKEALEHIEQYDLIAFDTETTGVNTRKDKIIGFSFTGLEGMGYYFSILEWRDEQLQAPIHNYSPYQKPHIILLNALSKKKTIMHNAAFDTKVTFNNFGIDMLTNLYSDTMLMQHTLDEDGPGALKEIAIQYKSMLGLDGQDAANQEQIELELDVKSKGGKWLKTDKQMYKASTKILAKYAVADVDLTLRVHKYFIGRLESEGLHDFFFKKEVMPLYKFTTVTMEFEGLYLCMPLLLKSIREIKEDIEEAYTKVIIALLATEEGQEFVKQRLAEEFPPKNSGSFAQEVVKLFELSFPKLDSGKFQINQKTIANCKTEVGSRAEIALSFLKLNDEKLLLLSEINEIQKRLLIAKDETEHAINISSKQQMGKIVFELMGIEPLTKTDKGAPQFNESMVEHLAEKHNMAWAEELRVYNKLSKILGSSFQRFYDEQEDGIFYPYFKQNGTSSGRYSSNVQQLSRPLEEGSEDVRIIKYTNIIRKLFIPKPGYVFIDDDYSSLEPCVFAHDSGDAPLLDIFIKGEDFYSKVAIMALGLSDCSADKKAPNFLKNLYPNLRQDAKCFTKGTMVKLRRNREIINSYIENVVVGDEILTQFGYKKVINLTGRKSNTLKMISTSRGGITCTPDHKIWDLKSNTWKEAKDFIKGDHLKYIEPETLEGSYQTLPVYTNASVYKKSLKSAYKIEITEEWGWIIGAFLGDGISSYCRRSDSSNLISSYVGVCGLKEDGVVDNWKNIMENLGFSCRLVIRKGEASKNKDLHTYISKDMEAVKLFQTSFGLIKNIESINVKGCKNLQVPEFIFNSPVKVRIAFLAGLIDTDGWVSIYNKMGLCTKDFTFATQICALLGTLGCKASLECSYNKTYRRYYYKIIPLAKSTQRLISLGLKDYMSCKRKKDNLLFRNIRNERSVDCDVKVIQTIEGNFDVYDVTVEEVHEFIANDFVVHNCYSLGIRYGAEAGKVSQLLKIEPEEAQKLVDKYFEAFPGLKARMEDYKTQAKKTGKVVSEFGRVRHLPRVRQIYDKFGDAILDHQKLSLLSRKHYIGYQELKDIRREYKNLLNNALNFPIQSAATSIINQAAIAICMEFREKGIDAWISAIQHDQIIVTAKEEQKEIASEIVQRCMETTNLIKVPLVAVPQFAYNMKDGH